MRSCLRYTDVLVAGLPHRTYGRKRCATPWHGGDAEQAADWAENCASFMIERSDVPTLLGWFSKLPAAIVNRRVRLRLAKAWVQALSYQFREARCSIEALANELARAAHDPDDSSASSPGSELRAEVAAVRAAIAGLIDDAPLALELSQQAEVPVSAPPWVLRFAHSAKIFGLAYGGGFDEIRRLRKALSEPDVEAEPLYASVPLQHAGLASLVEGRLQEAIETFESALARAEAGDRPRVRGGSIACRLPCGALLRVQRTVACPTRGERPDSDLDASLSARLVAALLPRGGSRLRTRWRPRILALVIPKRRVRSPLTAAAAPAGGQMLRASGCSWTLGVADAERLRADLHCWMAQSPSPMGSFRKPRPVGAKFRHEAARTQQEAVGSPGASRQDPQRVCGFWRLALRCCWPGVRAQRQGGAPEALDAGCVTPTPSP